MPRDLIGLKSITVAAALFVSMMLSRTECWGDGVARRARLGQRQIFSMPFDGSPSKEANTAPVSNRGQHNQSIDPSRPTNAADSQSPMSA